MGLSKFIKPTTLIFKSRKHIVDDTYSFTFKAENTLTWRAGQHGLLEIKLPSGRTSRRMFSLSSAPMENQVTITTHWRGELASNYKKALWSLETGDKTKIRGPIGPMYIRDKSSNNILIAGGIGITPFMSILKEAKLSKEDIHVTLLYANKKSKDVIFEAELDELSEKLTHLDIKYVYSPKKISEALINDSIGDGQLENANFYLSGPPKMVKAYKRLLKNMGVSRGRIYSDPFMGYK